MRMTGRIMKKSARFEPSRSFGTDEISFRAFRALFRILVFCLLAKLPLRAQSADSSSLPIAQVLLPVFTIQDNRFEQTGYKSWQADSLPVVGIMSLSNRLLWENVLDARTNAPGTLSTISIRGAGPTRTPVFWNGLNLQSPMNGVMDVALIPLWPEDRLEVRYGGQSAAQSNGAMGGSVVLTQGRQKFGQGFSGFAQGTVGSFNALEGSAGLGISGQDLSASARVAWQQADNDFKVRKQGLDGQFYTTQQVNNALNKLDFQQFNHWKIKENNLLKTAFWHQNTFRELPPATTEVPRETWQKDRSNRILCSWDFTPDHKNIWTSKVAWLEDYLAFHLAGDTDTSRSRQLLLSTENARRFGSNWSFRAGSTIQRNWAQVDGYSDSTKWFAQNRVAAFAMNEWRQKQRKVSLLLRQEWAEDQANPFTWSLGAQQSLGRVGEFRVHFSRNFNLPTLNDRFWKSLGRPNLRPEKGYSADLGWAYKQQDFSVEISAFNLSLDDWILWQPDSSGLFRPGNLRKVWSRGVEASAKGKITAGAWNMLFSGRFQLSKTTNQKVYGGAESLLGKQLPYTPKASGGLSFGLVRKTFSLTYLQQFTGARLDNGGGKIAEFSLGNLLGTYAFFKGRFQLEARIENLWNARYEIIRYRPMPGRSFRIGAAFKW